MNKLFGLFLLALAFLVPVPAEAASRFAVCATTCTWNNDGITTGIMWSTTSGGATGASAPVAGDDVTINAATCVGGTTCTITTFSGTISAQSVAWGACTASTTGCIIDASANNTNFTIGGGSSVQFNASSNGSRKWLGGTGTYTLTSTNNNGCVDLSGTGDLGSVFSNATWVCSGTVTSSRDWTGSGFSFGPTTFSANTGGAAMRVLGANTFASLTVAAPQYISFQNSTTHTITGALSVTGSTSSSLVSLVSTDSTLVATLSFAGSSTPSWVALRALTTTGAGTFIATNCIALGRLTFDTGDSCTPPSAGGGGGGRIIGG